MAIGIHPDDLEIGIFGTLAKSAEIGKTIIMVDLTAGEMGSNGTAKIRNQEAENAAKLINAKRICLGLPDRNIHCSQDQIKKVVECIRTYKPTWIIFPYPKDYHPDHESGSRLVKEAIHSAGLKQFHSAIEEIHRPEKAAMYYINDVERPNLYIDISSAIELKRQALECHISQFNKTADSSDTYLNNGYIEKIVTRDAYFGMLCKKTYAEALCLLSPPVANHLGGELL